jgi:hypothetical protein
VEGLDGEQEGQFECTADVGLIINEAYRRSSHTTECEVLRAYPPTLHLIEKTILRLHHEAATMLIQSERQHQQTATRSYVQGSLEE